MRVTAETKEATRQAILDVSRTLLRERGWENVSTREIAAAAEIANGTLFNYFPTKEAIVGALVADALAEANRVARDESAVEEQLFALVFAGVRRLRAYRSFLPYVIDAILAPAERTARSHDTERIREEHLAQVEAIIGGSLTAVQRHLYWSLYTGIVTFWVRDASPKQEQTLALVDQSMRLFAASLERRTDERRPSGTAVRAPAARRG